MAPGFDQLSDHDYDDELEDIDFSDLKDRYDVRMEEGLDTFVVRLLREAMCAKTYNRNRSSTDFPLSIQNRNPSS